MKDRSSLVLQEGVPERLAAVHSILEVLCSYLAKSSHIKIDSAEISRFLCVEKIVALWQNFLIHHCSKPYPQEKLVGGYNAIVLGVGALIAVHGGWIFNGKYPDNWLDHLHWSYASRYHYAAIRCYAGTCVDAVNALVGRKRSSSLIFPLKWSTWLQGFISTFILLIPLQSEMSWQDLKPGHDLKTLAALSSKITEAIGVYHGHPMMHAMWPSLNAVISRWEFDWTLCTYLVRVPKGCQWHVENPDLEAGPCKW